jgi:hypothetical protein
VRPASGGGGCPVDYSFTVSIIKMDITAVVIWSLMKVSELSCKERISQPGSLLMIGTS